MSACVVINLTVYFLLNSKSSFARGKGALYQIQQWGRKKTRVEKPCNMTVAIKEADIQSRIHIWNCFLSTSKHAEGALNLSSGYETTYQSILRMLPSIYDQKLAQWHTQQRNSVCFLGGSYCLWAVSSTSVAVTYSWADIVLLWERHQHTGSPFTGTEVLSELNWDQKQTICSNKEAPFVLSKKYDWPDLLLKLKRF